MTFVTVRHIVINAGFQLFRRFFYVWVTPVEIITCPGGSVHFAARLWSLFHIQQLRNLCNISKFWLESAAPDFQLFGDSLLFTCFRSSGLRSNGRARNGWHAGENRCISSQSCSPCLCVASRRRVHPESSERVAAWLLASDPSSSTTPRRPLKNRLAHGSRPTMGKHLDRDDVALALAYKFIPKSKLKKKLFLKDVQLAIQKRRKMENPRAKKPSISALSRLYKGGTHKAKRPDKRRTKKRKDPRGRPSKTTPKERRNLITVLNRKEKENKGRDVTAPYLLKNWEHEKEMSPATVSRILRKSGRPWRRSKKKIQLTPEAKAKRKAWAAYWRRRAKDFWQKHVLVTDEKTFRFHRIPKAKKVALTFKKTGSYCKAGEQAMRGRGS